MNEQIYYTYSTLGSGSTTGERFRAHSPELGSPTHDPLRALRKYLSYRLPAGTNQAPLLDSAPISLALVKTDQNFLLVNRVCAGKDGVGRPGNFFSHAIVDPKVISTQTGKLTPISAYQAINLWKSPLWKTSEDLITIKGTQLPGLAPEELDYYIGMQPNFNSSYWQAVVDWLPQVFSAFLMLQKLNKKHLYIAAPAEMVTTFIWCIARCLPHTLTIMQDLTFSTYEHEIAKASATIAGTCWLPPANHTGSFIPQADLPNTWYQDLPNNAVLAINCYTQKHTPFQVYEQINNFVQNVTQAINQNNFAQIEQIRKQAEMRGIQEVNDFLELFRIQQEPATKEMVQNILKTPQLFSCLQYPNIQDKLIDLLKHPEDLDWQNWWKRHGLEQFKFIRQRVVSEPSSEDEIAVHSLAERFMNELCQQLATDDLGPKNIEWAKFWDKLLNTISNPTTNLALWSTFSLQLSKLSYNKTYHFWWQQSGKKMTNNLVTNIAFPELPQLIEAFRIWFLEVRPHMQVAWQLQQDMEMSFWLDILQTIQPPTNGALDWSLLLNNLDRILPREKYPANWCEWEIYVRLLIVWQKSLTPQTLLPLRWLTVPWELLPDLLEVPDLSHEWKKFALEQQILRSTTPVPREQISYIARCTPLIHEVLAQLIQKDNMREQVVTFCVSILQQEYTETDALLAHTLPVLFLYQNHTNRIANAAGLPLEELNKYVEEPLYKALTSPGDIPPLLFHQLKSYLTTFRVQTINPDNQQITKKRRDRINTILIQLEKHSQDKTLPKELYDCIPYISCWYATSDFFVQPSFDLNKLLSLKEKIEVLSVTRRNDLNQEMIAFLSTHVVTELDIQRVIDNFGGLLLQEQTDDLPEHVLLLKEMTQLYGKAGHDQQRTQAYIKITLSEAIHLSVPGIASEKQSQFVDECLNDIQPTPFDLNQIKLTAQWPPSFQKLLDSYRTRHTIVKATRIPRNHATYAPNNPSSQLSTGGSQPKIVLSGSSQANQPLPQITTLTMNNASQPSTQHDPNADVVKKSHGKSQSIEEALKAFRKVLNSKRVDQIAEQYEESLDPWLGWDEIQYASVARKLVQHHEKAKKTGDYNEFIRLYNGYRTNYIFSRDITATAQQILDKGRRPW